MDVPPKRIEEDMRADPKRDFASLLDDLFVAQPEEEDAPVRPAVRFDYLAVADELHSGRIKVSSETLEAEYRNAAGNMEAELAALLAEADVAAAPEELPPVEPEAIALELGLAAAKSEDFGKLRRAFAFSNHPDRVAPHLRQRAMVRMQVANMLIDDAKRRAASKR